MKIVRTSAFRDPATDHQQFNQWVERLETVNGKTYGRIDLSTSLGKTRVWELDTEPGYTETLVIFPGFRTTPLFWDFENNLAELSRRYRIFLVETNGQPNPSDGNTPAIRGEGYGEWANEVVSRLSADPVFIAGASFGGLVCMKLCIHSPEKVKGAFLLNPGCLQTFSMKFKNLFYNLLPVVFPSRKTIHRFLDNIVFCPPEHRLEKVYEDLCIDYELFALTRYKDRTQKPYDMGDDLKKVTTPVYLLLGDRDRLFPHRKSARAAREKLQNLREVTVFENVGHGIETYRPAIRKINTVLEQEVRSATGKSAAPIG